MVVYHGTWFATDAGLIEVPIHRHLGWITFQKAIAGTFFGLVGVSLHLSAPARVRPFLQRLGLVLGGAAIVTATSLVLDPHRVVRFGILHAIAACSVLTLPLLRLPSLALLGVSGSLVAAGVGLRLPAFDHPALHWTGLSPTVAPTFDHQPLLPWLGVVAAGVVVGRALQHSPAARWTLDAPPARLLGWCGRHSLVLYMAHVPVLVGLVAAAAWLA